MLSRWSLLLFGVVALAGTAFACEGLSPGDQLDIPGAICTLGFIVANEDGLYFSTAGHCIQVDEPAGSPQVGKWGTGVFHYLDPETGGQSDGSPGNDFALISIDPAFYDQLNPKMCGWEGPNGIYDDAAGEGGGVKQYGHGAVLGDLQPKRQGVALTRSADRFYWIGPGVPGDSGGAVLADDGRALGVLTHLTVGLAGTNGGTTLQRGFDLAAAEGFTGLRLILAGEDPVKVLAGLQNGAPPAAAEDAVGPTGPGTAPSQAPSNTTKDPATNQSRPTPTPASPADGEGDGLAPAATTDPGNGDKKTPFAPPILLVLAFALAFALSKREK